MTVPQSCVYWRHCPPDSSSKPPEPRRSSLPTAQFSFRTATCTTSRCRVYQTDGRLGIDRVNDTLTLSRNTRGTYTVTFPQFWIGHIWLQPRGRQPNDTCTIELVWWPWQRTQRLRSGTVVTTRKATNTADTPDLQIILPPGWDLTTGLGVVPTALDINVGWRPVSFGAAARLVITSLGAIRKSLPPRTPQRRTDRRPARLRR
jgi:hypothetical protein